jgi:hypothetical protein
MITAYCFLTDSCTPGTTWRQDCNTCTCTENRVPVCTLKACITRPTRQFSRKLSIKTYSERLNSSVSKDNSLLGHDAVQFDRYVPALQSDMLPPSLGHVILVLKMEIASYSKMLVTCYQTVWWNILDNCNLRFTTVRTSVFLLIHSLTECQSWRSCGLLSSRLYHHLTDQFVWTMDAHTIAKGWG